MKTILSRAWRRLDAGVCRVGLWLLWRGESMRWTVTETERAIETALEVHGPGGDALAALCQPRRTWGINPDAHPSSQVTRADAGHSTPGETQ